MELGVNPLKPHDYQAALGGHFCLLCGREPEALLHTYHPADHSKHDARSGNEQQPIPETDALKIKQAQEYYNVQYERLNKSIPPPPAWLTKRRLVEEGIALILQGLGVKDNSIPQELVANLLLGLVQIARGDK